MKKYPNHLTTALFLFSSLLLSACAHQVPTSSGFLNDYSDLKPLQSDGNLRAAPVAEKWGFAAINVEPVQFIHDAQNPIVAEADQVTLCSTMEQALTQEFSNLSSSKAENTKHLKIKAAITGVDRSLPILNIVTALALFVPVDNGGISVEIEAVDEETGQRVAAMSGAWNGSPFAFSGYFKSYGHAEAGLRELAREFRQMVESDKPADIHTAQN